MKLVALNGLGTAIKRDFPKDRVKSGQVICPFKLNWTGGEDELHWVMEQVKGPYVLAALSDGCLPAYRIACIDPRVEALVIHSGEWHGPEETLGNATLRRIPIWFCRTEGDKTPTYDQTWKAFVYFNRLGYDVNEQTYRSTVWPWRPFQWFFAHEFANCVPDLLALVDSLGRLDQSIC